MYVLNKELFKLNKSTLPKNTASDPGKFHRGLAHCKSFESGLLSAPKNAIRRCLRYTGMHRSFLRIAGSVLMFAGSWSRCLGSCAYCITN